jgi:hypothetical protein
MIRLLEVLCFSSKGNSRGCFNGPQEPKSSIGLPLPIPEAQQQQQQQYQMSPNFGSTLNATKYYSLLPCFIDVDENRQ